MRKFITTLFLLWFPSLGLIYLSLMIMLQPQMTGMDVVFCAWFFGLGFIWPILVGPVLHFLVVALVIAVAFGTYIFITSLGDM